jgi:hypothetical protein
MDPYPIKPAPAKSLIADGWQRRTKHCSTIVSVMVILSEGTEAERDGRKDVSPPSLNSASEGRGERCADHFLAFAAVFASFFVAFFAAFSSTFFAMVPPFE